MARFDAVVVRFTDASYSRESPFCLERLSAHILSETSVFTLVPSLTARYTLKAGKLTSPGAALGSQAPSLQLLYDTC